MSGNNDDLKKHIGLLKDRKKEKDTVIKDPFEKDYARLVHCSYTRRLQGKTQIFSLNSCDFYRTRLTHSMEVSQISVGILHFLKEEEKLKEAKEKLAFAGLEDLLPSDLGVMAIGLAHDIGHPPFGHSGENMLNACMYHYLHDKNSKGKVDPVFEGNAQNIHIATQLSEYHADAGMNLTRRTLLGILKYPISYSEAVQLTTGQPSKPNNGIIRAAKPLKCYYDADQTHIDFMLEPLDDKIKEKLNTGYKVQYKNKLNKEKTSDSDKFMTLDCSLMEIADDISYGVHDLEDAIYLKLIEEKDFEEYCDKFKTNEAIKQAITNIDQESGPKTLKEMQAYLFSPDSCKRKRAISLLVKLFIRGTRIEANDWLSDIKSRTVFHYRVTLESSLQEFLQALKKLIMDKVVNSAIVRRFMFKGQEVLRSLFDAFWLDKKLLKNSKREKIKKLGFNDDLAKAKVIRDYLSGMTDNYAIRFYDRLFTPGLDSMFDQI